MPSCWLKKMMIMTDKGGHNPSKKTGTPVRHGNYTEIRTRNFEFHFNQKGEIKFIRGLTTDWPHPSERLKRTDGNDWVYYTVGKESGDKGIVSWAGEYYLPCLPYQSNSICKENPFVNPNIMLAFGAWSQLYADLYGAQCDGVPQTIRPVMDDILKSDENELHRRAMKLHQIIGERITVLPPDARHLDYEVIPLIVADGCQYHCRFCTVQSKQHYQPRAMVDILEQIKRLKVLYGPKLENYNALFLGNHDALGAGGDSICLAASEAYDIFGFDERAKDRPRLLMFGSVDSLLTANDRVFDAISALPFYTYINVGLESVDGQTLRRINKPLSVQQIEAAFKKMMGINRAYANIEVTANFLVGGNLSHAHHEQLTEFLANADRPIQKKGTVYLSPLMNEKQDRDVLTQFFEIKEQSLLNTFIYLIQRL